MHHYTFVNAEEAAIIKMSWGTELWVSFSRSIFVKWPLCHPSNGHCCSHMFRSSDETLICSLACRISTFHVVFAGSARPDRK